jgi:hypothetical protein
VGLIVIFLWSWRNKKNGTDIPVTCSGGPLGCETSRLPHFLNNGLTDGGEVVENLRYHGKE